MPGLRESTPSLPAAKGGAGRLSCSASVAKKCIVSVVISRLEAYEEGKVTGNSFAARGFKKKLSHRDFLKTEPEGEGKLAQGQPNGWRGKTAIFSAYRQRHLT